MNAWRGAGHAAVALLLVVTTGALKQAPAAQGRRTLSGDLIKAVDQYTGDEFFALVNRLNYTGGQDRARRCRGNAACQQTQRTNVRVDAVADADSLGPGNVAPFGVIAMRAIVRGNDTEARYGMQSAGPNGRFAYFLIVTPGGAGTVLWRLEELNVQAGVRTHRMLTQGQLRMCNHPFVRGARADFKTCDPVAAPASFGGFFQGVEPPIWIGCSSGCCIADAGAGA